MNSRVSVTKMEVDKIGKLVPSSKEKYTWDIVLEDKQFKIQLYYSKISLKYVVKVNGKTFTKRQGEDPKRFRYSTNIYGHAIKIAWPKKGTTFQLYIDHTDCQKIVNPEQDTTFTTDISSNHSGDLGSFKSGQEQVYFDDRKNPQNKRLNSSFEKPQHPKEFKKIPKTTDYTNKYKNADIYEDVGYNDFVVEKKGDLKNELMNSDIFFKEQHTVLETDDKGIDETVIKEIGSYKKIK